MRARAFSQTRAPQPRERVFTDRNSYNFQFQGALPWSRPVGNWALCKGSPALDGLKSKRTGPGPSSGIPKLQSRAAMRRNRVPFCPGEPRIGLGYHSTKEKQGDGGWVSFSGARSGRRCARAEADKGPASHGFLPQYWKTESHGTLPSSFKGPSLGAGLLAIGLCAK